MKAIILAAGRGTRLKSYCENKPKCLVEVDGATLLSRNISVLRNSDYDVTVVGGYRASQISALGVSTIVNELYESTNMVVSLFCAEKILMHGALITYGDIVYSPKILSRLTNSPSDISVAVDKNWFAYWSNRMTNPLEDLESLQINENGDIIEIGSKASKFQEIEGQYIGLTKVT
ncbi:phosphocholine cytidylyltransferase family protein, partial [Alphaproteobacteria bacterium]|nr:phosphocholine cytidylyltransferase family protein [Alphaproteobacteria bacterium]